MRESLGLNDPFLLQYGRYLLRAVQGDFGVSYRHRRPVKHVDRRAHAGDPGAGRWSRRFWPWLIGVPMGVYTGLHREGFTSKIFMTISLMGISLPTFLIGILLILVFGVIMSLQWLPTFGRGEVVELGLVVVPASLTAAGLKALIMPSITLALFQMTLIMRLVRSEMLEVLRTDYIKFARARGLTNRAINFGHALKNTMVPVITITGLQLGSIIAFAIITESGLPVARHGPPDSSRRSTKSISR